MEIVHILLQNFSQYLTSQNASDSTVKNYLADIGLFFRFLQNHQQPISLLTLPHQLSNENIPHYHQYLISNFPSSTVKRRISSLNKFIAFINSPLPPPPHSKNISVPLFAIFIILIISVGIIGGYLASSSLPPTPIGLADPSVTFINRQTR